MGKFHWKDGIHFERTEDGSVRVTRDNGLIFTIDANSWPSIVAAVSKDGSTTDAYHAADTLHTGKIHA